MGDGGVASTFVRRGIAATHGPDSEFGLQVRASGVNFARCVLGQLALRACFRQARAEVAVERDGHALVAADAVLDGPGVFRTGLRFKASPISFDR